MAYPQETFLTTRLVQESLISRRRGVAGSKTLSYQLEMLKKTGRYDAFDLHWHSSYEDPPDVWPIPNHLFWDSDIAKWIEGACYFLHEHEDPKIDAAVKELVNMIRGAQLKDGYINIHYTVVKPGERFTNLRDFHELYNAGHLIEAALAHHQLYRNDDLLGPILKYVQFLCGKFGPKTNQTPGYPGHSEVELALLRLYHRTQNPAHLELAKFFITERGNPNGVDGCHYYHFEARQRGEEPGVRMPYWGEADALWYYQAHKPLVEQQTIKGHSVRAMYLLSAAADLVRLDQTSDGRLKDAIYRLWDNMVTCKMYVTGGIGAIKQWEGFGPNYFLPQGTDEGGCYAETCAAIGVMMLAERILQYDLDRRFSDIMELSLYNAVLTAMSYDGTKFTYVNQLASSDEDLSKREEWFKCACCPPNILRLLGQIGGYIYTRTTGEQERLSVHLYISSSTEFKCDDQRATLIQKTDWPWSGRVDFNLETQALRITVSLALRIPGWAKEWTMIPRPPPNSEEKGYLILPATWLSVNRSFTLDIDISPRLVAPHPFTNQDTLAVVRGPIVYCVEDVDNPWVLDHFKSILLDAACSFDEKTVTDDTTGDTYVALTATKGVSMLTKNSIHAYPGVECNGAAKFSQTIIPRLNFVPYYFKANRGGFGHARVGLRRWHHDI
ncbi:uncharacterized protein Z519_04043 [Cladophialophora bantiana CBS 173.52]|uniref:DUF1680 domain protein n=1 Tax=Cladophialophora bantiana (strain ATCC 10958 / CBS 173.52 / CDC B-1940 / NIH 8579) TaxID=1442370 RepID=A0A0D2IFA4_CLAB1|nr:uncharacterized protein Z519_04043 [Cladophialophora bantiana CBS 173.52]KIW95459.1 hypothetical protein Z519_04043 [Cladophialophora bantiana CBS 173.52]